MEKMSSGFPSYVLWLLCHNSDSRKFLKATCRLPANRSCSCSSGSLLGTALLNCSCRTSEGKPEDIFSVKYDPVLLKLLFCVTYKRAKFSFIFWSHWLQLKLHSDASSPFFKQKYFFYWRNIWTDTIYACCHLPNSIQVIPKDQTSTFPSYWPSSIAKITSGAILGKVEGRDITWVGNKGQIKQD